MVARRAHNPKVVGSNPAPATKYKNPLQLQGILLYAVLLLLELFERPSEPLCFRQPFYWPMSSAANLLLSFILSLCFSDGLLLFRIGIVAQVFFQALQLFFV